MIREVYENFFEKMTEIRISLILSVILNLIPLEHTDVLYMEYSNNNFLREVT